MNKTLQELVNVGKTVLRVMRKTVNEATGQEKIEEIHSGIVVASWGAFVRIFNPAPLDKGGDVNPETSEAFPLAGKRMWCELVSERVRGIPIPASLR